MNIQDLSLQIFDDSSDLICCINDNLEIIYTNASWQNTLGYSNESLSGRPIDEIIKLEFGQVSSLIREGHTEKPQHYFELISKFHTNLSVSGQIHKITLQDDHGQCYLFILQANIEKQRFEKVELFFSRITTLTLETKNIEEMYRAIHQELKEILIADNFYIALIQDEVLTFPYYVDEKSIPQPRPYLRSEGMGITEYVLFKDQATLLYREGIEGLIENGKINPIEHIPSVWLGAPLKIENKAIGLLAVKSYRKDADYIIQDIDLLNFVSGQIALAIDRKLHLEEIQSQAARLKAIFEQSNNISCTLNRQWKFTSFNTNFSNLFEQIYGEEPKLNRPAISPTFFNQWRELFDRVLAGEYVNVEFKHTTREGDIEWKDIYLNPIYIGGEVDEISAIGIDVTEKKETLLQLRKSEEKFRNIYESFQDIHFRCKLNGIIEMISPSVLEQTGYSSSQLIGKNITNFYLYTQRTKDLIRQLVRDQRVRNFEASIVKNDGTIITCLCNVRLLKDQEDASVYIEGVARDITYLKKVNKELVKAKEVAEHSLKVKEQFLANMSHELRTPMNGVIGMISLLKETTLDQKQSYYVDTIKKSSETLLVILNDILDLSKIEAGKMALKLKPVSLLDLLNKIIALFSHMANQKNIKLRLDHDPATKDDVILDETRTLQVLSNLVSNAIKFTPENGNVTVATTMTEKTLRFSISDTGIGISDEDQQRLFTNFTQLDNSTTKAFSGTGLGLAISKNLTHLMGGDIGVESTLGKGSTFWFSVQLHQLSELSDFQEVTKSEEVAISGFFSDLSPKILLVDDNRVNQQVANEILEKAGASVTLAFSGSEAIDQATHNRFDIIFMDIQMPEMDGITASKRMREKLGSATPPIIAMTAYSMEDDRKQFLSEGLNDYISKPIIPVTLVEVTAKWMNMDTSGLRKAYIEENNSTFQQEVADQLVNIGGLDMLKSVYADFFEETFAMLQQSDDMLRQGEFEDIRRNLHTIKGNAGTLGALKLASLVKKVEGQLKNNVFSGLKSELTQIKKEFERFTDKFNAYYSSITQHESKEKSIDS